MSSIYGSAAGANVIFGQNNIGVAFGGVAGPTPKVATDFDVLDEWVQSPDGTVTWSNGTIPNYARNSAKVTGINWEITADFSASDHNVGELVCCGLSNTATPNDKDYFNYAWVLDVQAGYPSGRIYWFRKESDGTNAAQGYFSYNDSATYTIKCTGGAITFLEDETVKYTPASPQFDFDASANTEAYVSVGQGQTTTIVVSVTDNA